MPLHIYLSPHLDDAILSCGGIIYNQRAAVENIVVINFCAGVPDYHRLSPFARQYHVSWGNSSDPMAIRLAEDRSVLDRLGIDYHNFNTLDSIYRDWGGVFTYPDLAALLNAPHPYECNTLPVKWQSDFESLYSTPYEAIVYAPLAAGNHVDHQLVRNFALQLQQSGWKVLFYEDYPHVESPDSIRNALSWFGPKSWDHETTLINVKAKIESIRGYRTQVQSIFGNDMVMEKRVRQYTAQIACEISRKEYIRSRLAGSGGRRERLWRTAFGYHAHTERVWSYS